jgi:centromere/kinetochore protein ZW10
MLGNDDNDRPVKAWADGVCGHYERQRRTQILDSSRTIIISPENYGDRFLVDVEVSSATSPIAVPIQDKDEFKEVTKDEFKDDAWGFDDDVTSGTGSSFEVEADGWGFDDDVIPDFDAEPKVEPKPEEPSSSPEMVNGEHEDEPDPSDAWGWNGSDNVDPPEAEETAWDDPWGDEPSSVIDSRPPPAPSITSPKVATRLEKAANKGKKRLSENSPMDSPEISTPLSSDHSLASGSILPKTGSEHTPSEKQPSGGAIQVPKESYSVSGRMRRVIRIVEDVLNEGKQFTAAKMFPPSESTSAPGSVILQSASSILDLHIALYPVKFSKDLAFPECGMQFSNDCMYLSGEVERVRNAAAMDMNVPAVVQERLSECTKRHKLLADSWYHDVIVRPFPWCSRV